MSDTSRADWDAPGAVPQLRPAKAEAPSVPSTSAPAANVRAQSAREPQEAADEHAAAAQRPTPLREVINS
jgi:hypothetical protein